MQIKNHAWLACLACLSITACGGGSSAVGTQLAGNDPALVGTWHYRSGVAGAAFSDPVCGNDSEGQPEVRILMTFDGASATIKGEPCAITAGAGSFVTASDQSGSYKTGSVIAGIGAKTIDITTPSYTRYTSYIVNGRRLQLASSQASDGLTPELRRQSFPAGTPVFDKQ